MKTSGFRCETKFALLFFLGHPNDHFGFAEPLRVVEVSHGTRWDLNGWEVQTLQWHCHKHILV